MFVAPSAGLAIGSNARFADLGQGALDGWPKFLELAEKVLAERGVGGFWICHGMYTISYTYYDKKKNTKSQ
jgi:hypothetical protein